MRGEKIPDGLKKSALAGLARGKRVSDVAKALGIPTMTVHTWKKAAEEAQRLAESKARPAPATAKATPKEPKKNTEPEKKLAIPAMLDSWALIMQNTPLTIAAAPDLVELFRPAGSPNPLASKKATL